MGRSLIMDLLKNKYVLIVGGLISLSVVIALSGVMSGGGTGTVSDNGKLDQSKKVKSNVGDTTLGQGAMQLEGVSVGGNVGQIGSNTTEGNAEPQ